MFCRVNNTRPVDNNTGMCRKDNNASSKKDVFFYESPTSTHNDIMGGGGMSYAYEYDVKYNICHLRKKSRMR
ncbi:hypothetical protein [Escherichia coli]|uniref:hypothetical protein n=1 Tax=Escherichia coli TaxID=562 RepID=UPI0034E2FB76